MAAKDDPKIQRARIERLVREMEPHSHVTFDLESEHNQIRFRVTSPTGVDLIPFSGHYMPSEIADKSDENLKALIRSLSADRIR
jgi:hypothetical protein